MILHYVETHLPKLSSWEKQAFQIIKMSCISLQYILDEASVKSYIFVSRCNKKNLSQETPHSIARLLVGYLVLYLFCIFIFFPFTLFLSFMCFFHLNVSWRHTCDKTNISLHVQAFTTKASMEVVHLVHCYLVMNTLNMEEHAIFEEHVGFFKMVIYVYLVQ